MAGIRRVEYTVRRKLWCERCGKCSTRDYEYAIPMRGSSSTLVIEALVCAPCANAIRALGRLALPAMYERLHI